MTEQEDPGSWIPAFRKRYDEAHGPYQWRNIYEIDEELFIYADALQAESKRRKRTMEEQVLWYEIGQLEQGMKAMHESLDRMIAECSNSEQEAIRTCASTMKQSIARAFEWKITLVEMIQETLR